MSIKNKTQLKAEVNTAIRVGGQPTKTKATDVRNLLLNVIDSGVSTINNIPPDADGNVVLGIFDVAGTNAPGSAIIGGINNQILTEAERSVILGGQNIQANDPDTVYVPNLVVTGNIRNTDGDIIVRDFSEVIDNINEVLADHNFQINDLWNHDFYNQNAITDLQGSIAVVDDFSIGGTVWTSQKVYNRIVETSKFIFNENDLIYIEFFSGQIVDLIEAYDTSKIAEVHFFSRKVNEVNYTAHETITDLEHWITRNVTPPFTNYYIKAVAIFHAGVSGYAGFQFQYKTAF